MRYRAAIKQSYIISIVLTAILSMALYTEFARFAFIGIILCIGFIITIAVLEYRTAALYNNAINELRESMMDNQKLRTELSMYKRGLQVTASIIEEQHKKIEELEKSQLCPEEYVNWASILN